MGNSAQYLSLVEEALEQYMTVPDLPQKAVYESMAYSLAAGGKRIRPVLCLAACDLLGGNIGDAIPFACAVEMIHTYSLIHDDLPCMDDDDYRRGQPSNHKKFGEAVAVLAGDGLLTRAFETASDAPLSPELVVRGMRILAQLAGVSGMIGGQIVDMEAEHCTLSAERLLYLHEHKTGALIRAPLILGALSANVIAGPQVEALEAYGRYLGLAFQVRDDMLDVIGNVSELGKPVQSDAENEKTTFVSMYGLKRCEAFVEEYTHKAVNAVAGIGGDGGFLIALAQQLAHRRS